MTNFEEETLNDKETDDMYSVDRRTQTLTVSDVAAMSVKRRLSKPVHSDE